MSSHRILFVVIAGLCLSPRHVASQAAGDLATGPHATLHGKLERTMFDIDVLSVAVRVDEPARREIARAVASGRSEDSVDRIARAVAGAERARARVRFLRDIELAQFLEGVREDLAKARDARMIDGELHDRIVRRLPSWFGAIEDRGFREGDELYYDIRPGGLRTVLLSEGGQRVDAQVLRDPELGRAVLAGYVAPGATFRGLLIESLF